MYLLYSEACHAGHGTATVTSWSLQVHWFSILNSMMVVVVMSCIVAMIMMRTIRKDLAQYESLIVDSGGAAQHAHPAALLLSVPLLSAPCLH
jgi:Endomembrane protein 70